MLNDTDYQEAVRRYKNMKLNGHERQRYHALILVHQGYTYRETAAILLVDEETASRWVRQYEVGGLDNLRNDPRWGGEHGQRELSDEEVAELKRVLREEAMPGSKFGSGWTARAVRDFIAERFGVRYKKSGVRKILSRIEWSYQRGRRLYLQRTVEDQARYEWETSEVLEKYANTGEKMTPLAADQSKIYLEGTIAWRWNPRGEQPLVADGSRGKQSESLYGAVHLGTGEEVAPFAIDWQDSDATICWYELVEEACPTGDIVIWQDQAPHHTSDEVAEWLEEHPRIKIVNFPKYTPEENPKEKTWKDLKEEVTHHKWHETMNDLRAAVNRYYQSGKKHVVNFLEKFGYQWIEGRIYPLLQTG